MDGHRNLLDFRSWPIATCEKGLQTTDSVEKVGHPKLPGH
jgi:hypothetical protein